MLDDTLVYYIVGDNGASAEGTLNGTFNELFSLTVPRRSRPPSPWRPTSTSSARPAAYNHYAVGWAHAWTPPTSGPSRWHRTSVGRATAPSCTGRKVRRQGRDPLAVPPRHRRGHDRARCRRPARTGDGQRLEQRPLQACDDYVRRAGAAERRETQYFEMLSNRGIYHKGWTAVTRHSNPWVFVRTAGPGRRLWELYDTSTDWRQAHDVAADHPRKAGRAAAAVAHRGGEVPGAAAG